MACAHVHGIYPYFYIEYKHSVTPEKVRDYVHQLGLSINQSLAFSLRRNMSDKLSTTQFVRAIVICKGTPFYGYNVGTRPFLKIMMNDPKHIPRLVQLMESGQLMNSTFQPFESHSPYLLQFFTDFNLYGCDWLELSQAKYRYPLPEPTVYDWHSDQVVAENVINASTIDEKDTHNIPRDTNCVLEFDVRASWIENRYRIAPRYIHNAPYEELVPDEKLLPSLRELWLNEEKRREAKGLPSSIQIQGSVKGGRNDSATFPLWDNLDDILDSFFDRISDTNNGADFAPPFTEEHHLMTVFESTEALFHPSERRKELRNEDSSQYLDISSSQPNKDIEPIVSQQLATQKSNVMNMDIDNNPFDSFAQNTGLHEFPGRALSGRESTMLSDSKGSMKQLSLMDSMYKSSETPLKREPTLEVVPDSQESEQPQRKRSRSNSSDLLASQEYEEILANLSQRQVTPGLTIGMIHTKIEEATPRKLLSSSQNSVTTPRKSQAPRINQDKSIYKYSIPPPTIEEALQSLKEQRAPTKIYRDPYYSNASDVPERPREYAGRVFVLKGDVIPSWDGSCDTYSTRGARYFEYAPLPPSKRSVVADYKSKKASSQKVFHTQIEGPPSGQVYGLDASTASGGKKYEPREHDVQTQLTMMVVEVFARSNNTKVSNPEYNPVEAVFFSYHDMNEDVERGMIVVEGETKYKLDGYDMEIAINEADLIFTLIDKVQHFDPDILAGWDTELGSWGYLVERTRIEIGLELSEETSRIKSRTMRNINGGERWAEMKTSTFTSPGRHVFNVWRLARSELSLPQTTFEHVTHSLLKRRVPKYEPVTLSQWWVSGNASSFARVLDVFTSRVKLIGDILDSMEIITKTASEFARTIGVDFYSVISRGSQFKVEALMFRIAKPENYVLISPSRNQVGSQQAAEALPLVMEPQSAFYKDPVIVLDFQSLYPSIILAYNYCYSTCLGRVKPYDSKYKFGIIDHAESSKILDALKNDINFAPNGLMYVKPHVRKSLLSKMLAELLDTRIMIKESMQENRDDKYLKKLQHARQLSLKLMANVTYGYTSASYSGRMPSVELADSIVQTGRETLERAIQFIERNEEWGADVVYGDTDSLFVRLKGKSQKEAFETGAAIAEAVTKSNPRPIKLKLEKMYLPSVLLAKKRYTGNMFERSSDTVGVFEAKGIETVRRDGVPAQAKMVEAALKVLYKTSDLSQVKEYCVRQFNKVIQGRVSIQDFTFAKEVRLGTYSNNVVPIPGVMVATKALTDDPRAAAHYGERVPYVITEGSSDRQVDRAVKPEEILRNGNLRIDAKYYIERVLIPPLERIFNLMGADVHSWYATMSRKFKAEARKPFTHTRRGGVIGNYVRSGTCETCGEASKEAICSSCRADSNISDTVYKLLSRNYRTQSKMRDFHTICASCAHTLPSQDVPCVNLDCGLLYKKAQNEIDTEELDGLDQILQGFDKKLSW
ncbi:hypothetical protein E3P86_00505 [Wallemia ichthyophaga]|uniref:DNA polymerase n=1 Tax=Wallemia ichthyophaga TaxID=245174 RepID=A0A4T0JGJ5_WALIC|nr:hypothetical protein E3P86_00505 [Wallemia ichthyophaga]